MKILTTVFLLIAGISTSFAMEEGAQKESADSTLLLRQYVPSRFDNLEIEEGKRENLLEILTSFTFDEYLNFLKILFGKLKKVPFIYSKSIDREEALLTLKRKFPGILVLDRVIAYKKSKEFLNKNENLGGFAMPLFKSIVSKKSHPKFIELLLLLGAQVNKDRLDCTQPLDSAEKIAPDIDKAERIEVLKKYGAVNSTKCSDFGFYTGNHWWDAHNYYDQLDAKIIEFYENAHWEELVNVCELIGEPRFYPNKSVGTFRWNLLNFINGKYKCDGTCFLIGLERAIYFKSINILDICLLAGKKDRIKKGIDTFFERSLQINNCSKVLRRLSEYKKSSELFSKGSLEEAIAIYFDTDNGFRYSDEEDNVWLKNFKKFCSWIVYPEITIESFAKHVKAFCNVLTDNDKLPLNEAIDLNDYHIIKILLLAGAKVNGNIADDITKIEPYKDYENPLHKAIRQKCSVDIIKLLLNHGADQKIRDCFESAILTGRCQVVSLLAEYKNENDSEAEREQYIALAKEYSSQEMVSFLNNQEVSPKYCKILDEDEKLYQSLKSTIQQYLRGKTQIDIDKRESLYKNSISIIKILCSLSHKDTLILKKVLFGTLAHHPISRDWVHFVFHGKYINTYPGLCDFEWILKYLDKLTLELFNQRTQGVDRSLKNRLKDLFALCDDRFKNNSFQNSKQNDQLVHAQTYKYEKLDEKIIFCLQSPCYSKKTLFWYIGKHANVNRMNITQSFVGKTIKELRTYLLSIKDDDKKSSDLLIDAQKNYDLPLLKLLLEMDFRPKTIPKANNESIWARIPSKSLELILIEALNHEYSHSPVGKKIIQTLIGYCKNFKTAGYGYGDKTLLEHAIKNHHMEAIELLLAKGSDPNYIHPGVLVHTPLNLVLKSYNLLLSCEEDEVNKRDLQLLKKLLDAGADPAMCNRFDLSPLDLAKLLGKKEAVKLLESYVCVKKNTKILDQNLYTSLNFAQKNSIYDFGYLYQLFKYDEKTREQLIFKKIKEFLDEIKGNSVFIYLLKSLIGDFKQEPLDFYKKLRRYIRNKKWGGDGQKRDRRFVDAFLRFDNLLLIEILILMTANDCTNYSSSLCNAFKENLDPAIFNRLLIAGAPLDQVDEKGDTPLHIAVFKNRQDIVNMLLYHGADISVTNDYGFTAAKMAYDDPERAEIFRLMKDFNNENYAQSFLKNFYNLFLACKSKEDKIRIFSEELNKYKKLKKDNPTILEGQLQDIIFNGEEAKLTMYRMEIIASLRFNGDDKSLIQRVIMSNDAMLLGLFLLASSSDNINKFYISELYDFACKWNVNKQIKDMLFKVLYPQKQLPGEVEAVSFERDCQETENSFSLRVDKDTLNDDREDTVHKITKKFAQFNFFSDKPSENDEGDKVSDSHQINLTQFNHWFKICKKSEQVRRAVVLKLIKDFLLVYPGRRKGKNKYYGDHKIDEIIYNNFFHEKSPEQVLNALVENSEDRHQIHYLRTSFYLAIRCRDPLLVQLFLLAGANPNCCTSDSRNTPLHRAAGWGDKENVHLLLIAGANKEAENCEGQTPSQYATNPYTDENEDIVRLIDDFK